MIIASIDIGSNSVLLLLAEIDTNNKILIKSKTYYETPRISEGANTTGIINEYRQKLLFDVLNKYYTIIRSSRTDLVLATATKAFRIAKNSELIVKQINEKFGWDAKIISGDDEAKLTFLGTTYPFNKLDEIQGVIDIGGGSTEIVYGNSLNIIFKESFDIGVVTTTEKFFKSSPPSEVQIENAINHIDSIYSKIHVTNTESSIFHAVAGTPTSLACINLGIREFNEAMIDNFMLQLKDIIKIKNELMTKDAQTILSDYGEVVSGREDVLLAGTLILERFMMKMGIQEIKVSVRGLRFGVLYKYLNWV